MNPNSVPASAEQTITIEDAPSGGTFTLTFKGQTTAPIAFNAPSEGQAASTALDEFSTIGSGGVFVVGRDGGPYTV